MKRRVLLALLGAGWALVRLPVIAHACSVCLTGADDPTADAFNASVLFLMATPYLVFGSIVGGLAYTFRRAAVKQQRSEAAQPDLHLAWNEKESGG